MADEQNVDERDLREQVRELYVINTWLMVALVACIIALCWKAF